MIISIICYDGGGAGSRYVIEEIDIVDAFEYSA